MSCRSDRPTKSNCLFVAIVFAVLVLAGLLLARPAHGKNIATVVATTSFKSVKPPETYDQRAMGALGVAQALQKAGYAVGFVRDEDVTKAGLENYLTNELPRVAAPGDTVFLYFSCLAVGGDFNEPYLLVWDSDPNQVAETSVSVTAVAEAMASHLEGVHLVIVSDTTRLGQVGDLALIGPSAADWNKGLPNAFVATVSVPRGRRAEWSGFAAAVAEGLGQAADTSSDGVIKLSEFRSFLEGRASRESGDALRLDVMGAFDPAMSVAAIPKTVLVSSAPPPAATPLPAAPVKPIKKGHRVLGWSLLGSGLAAGLGSGALYAVGQSYLEEPRPEDRSVYETVRTAQIASGAAGGLLAATGAGIVVFRF